MKKILLALDIGNVCVRIDHNNCIKQFPDAIIPEGLFQLARDYECGVIKEEEIFIRQALEISNYRFTADEFKSAFESIIISPVPGMTELVRDFTGMGVKAVYFSDISPTHLNRTREIFPAFDAVEDGVFSFDAGAWKPDVAMFSRFERLHGIPDLYVDDREELICAAIEHGWNAEIFTSSQDLREKLLALS